MMLKQTHTRYLYHMTPTHLFIKLVIYRLMKIGVMHPLYFAPTYRNRLQQGNLMVVT